MKLKDSELSFKHFLLINLGVLMMAAGIYFFKAPNGFATGGVSGIAIVLAKLPFSIKLNITQSIYMLIMNILLLIIGVLVLGKKCGGLTIYCSLMLSFENLLLEKYLPIDFEKNNAEEMWYEYYGGAYRHNEEEMIRKWLELFNQEKTEKE